MWIFRSAQTARLSRSLLPSSPRQAPRQSRGLLALPDARTCSLRSKKSSGHRKSLDSRTDYGSAFSHERRLPCYRVGSLCVTCSDLLRHERVIYRVGPKTQKRKEVSREPRNNCNCGASFRARFRRCDTSSTTRGSRYLSGVQTKTAKRKFCARKEEADNECRSTPDRIMSQLFAMRSLNPSFNTDSFCSSSASSPDFSDSLPHPLRNEKTPNNGAAENCSGRWRVSRWLLPAEPAAQPARHAPPPSAVSELESLGDFARLSCERHQQKHS